MIKGERASKLHDAERGCWRSGMCWDGRCKTLTRGSWGLIKITGAWSHQPSSCTEGKKLRSRSHTSNPSWEDRFRISTGLRCHRSSAGSFLLHPGTWARTEVMSALLKHLSRRRYLALKILWHLSMRCTPRQRELSSRSRRALSSFWSLNIIHLSSYEVIHIQILLDVEDLFISSVYSAHRELVLWLILFLCFLCFNNDLPSSIWLWIDGGDRERWGWIM